MGRDGKPERKRRCVLPRTVHSYQGVGSMRLSFVVASSFSESRKRMAGEELSLFKANLDVKVVPERFFAFSLVNQ